MNDLTAEVVVVGAGPSGSMAAKTMAENGVDVLVLEKKQEIGTPKRCAEGLSIDGLQEVGLEPHQTWINNSTIIGSIIIAPSGNSIIVDTKKHGYILERKIFEKDLARMAIVAGARYKVKTHVNNLKMEDGKITGVECEFMGEKFTVNSKMVIACDGVDSMIAKKAGINSLNVLNDYHSGFQYEMAGVNASMERLSLFFGNEIAPKGYVWIFPKGKTVANVGIGIVGNSSNDTNRARDYLDKFIKNNPEMFSKASPIEVNAGGIPVNPRLKNFVKDNFMVVGDAAQQVNPIHGGGIALALKAGKLAGEVASKAIKEGDVSKQRLQEFEDIWNNDDGKVLDNLLKFRYFLEKLDDSDYERLVKNLNGDDINKVITGDVKAMIKVFMKIPKLLPLARKALS